MSTKSTESTAPPIAEVEKIDLNNPPDVWNQLPVAQEVVQEAESTAEMSDYTYINSFTGTAMKCERHGIVGKKDGDVDEREVYRLNILNMLPGNTIWNKYHNPMNHQYNKGILYITNDQVKTKTPSSEKEVQAYNEQVRQQDTAKTRHNKQKKLRL